VACQGGDAREASSPLQQAILHHQEGDVAGAIERLREGIATDPPSPELHGRLGYEYRYAGMLDASVTSYRRAQELAGDAAWRISTEGQIAKSLIYMGQYTAAIRAHQEIYRLLEGMGEAPDEKVLFYDGVAHLYGGRTDEAIRLFDASRATASTLWSTFAEGYTHLARGDTGRLLELARELEVRDDLADGERRYRLVHFFAGGGEADRALHHLRAAIEAGFFAVPYLREDPLTAGIRTGAGFEEVLERAAERRAAVSGPQQ
jgi:tetratricopeptide (TPR) repeat protein